MDDKSYHVRVPKRWARMAMIVGVTALIVAPLTAAASHVFTDVPDSHTFHTDITWLEDSGVTKGCNPPQNTEFCPDDNVTRGQMAAFMQRFADYIDAGDGTPAQADHAATAGDADTLDGFDSSDLLGSETLAPGSTIRGAFAMGGTGELGDALSNTEISFGYTLDAAPEGHFIQVGETPPEECPGTSDEPEAEPGHLCVYERLQLNAAGISIQGPGGSGSTYPFGAELFLRSNVDGDYSSSGSWAVTAG